MNANCLSCFATTPYLNGIRPKFCSSCGKSLDISTSKITQAQPQQQTVRLKTQVQDGEEREFEGVNFRSLSMDVRVVGEVSSPAITLGQMASQNFTAPAINRQAYQGDALKDIDRETMSNSRNEIVE